MNKKKSAWGYPHAPAVHRWGRMVLALTLSAALLVSALPVGALAEGVENQNQTVESAQSPASIPSQDTPQTLTPETNTPGHSETPAPPENTGIPETPETPENPVNPENPENPKDSASSENPENPQNPGKTENGEVPENPENAENSEDPKTPENPETPESNGDPQADPAVEHLKALLDALPETVTQDNAETVAAQLEAIAEARAALTEDQLGQLDFARYDAVLAAWTALVDGSDGLTTFGGWSADAVARVDINGEEEYYKSFREAYDRVKNCTASDNASIKLINNPGIYGTQYLESGVFTLDVYGEQLDTSASHTSILSIKGATVTFQNTTTNEFKNPISLQSGSLHIAGGQYGDIASVTVDGGTLRVTNIYSIDNLTVSGGEAALSKGKFYNLVVTGGTVCLSGGYYGSIQVPNGTSVAGLLKTGYVYRDWDTHRIFESATLTQNTIEDVSVIECPHEIENGICKYCGIRCPHQNLDENGKCTACGEVFAASVTIGDSTTLYSTLPEAITAAQSGTEESPATVKVLGNVDLTSWPSITGVFTLDMNGKAVEGTMNMVNPWISGGKMTLTGGGSFSVQDIYVRDNGSLIISDQCTASISPITVSDNGKLNSSGGSTAILYVNSFTDGSIILSGGSYSMIQCSAVYNGKDVTVADLLEPGCGIQDKKYKDLENALKLDVVSGNSYTVVPCAAHDVGTDGRCAFCNTQFCAQIQTPNYGPYYFTTLQAALDAREAIWTNAVVSLLKDAEAATISQSATTLDLNGHNLGNLTVKTYFYLKNSGETSTIQTIHFTGAYDGESFIYTNNICKDGWWFKINGKWAEEKVTLENGMLTGIQVCKAPIQSLTIDTGTGATVHLGDSVSLTASVTTLSGATENVTYRWYQTYQWGDRETDLNEHKETYTFTPSEEGEFYFNCEATCDGFHKSVRVTVTAEKQDISTGNITLPAQPVYNGTEQTMNVASLTWNGQTLHEGTDYTVGMPNNAGIATDVEEKTVTIKGINNYKGEQNVTWKLQKADVPGTYVKSVESRIYYGKPHTGDNRVAVTLPELPKGGMVTNIQLGEAYREGTTDQYGYTIFPSGQTEVVEGTLYYSVDQTREPVYADITLTVESQNYEPYTITVHVNLVDKTQVSIRGTMTGDGQLVYNQNSQAPEITLTVDPEVGVEAKYYEYSEDSQNFLRIPGKPKDVGRYQVVYSVPESNEIYMGESQAFEYFITPKDITVHGIEGIRKPYDGNRLLGLDFKNVTLTGVFDGDKVEVNGVTANDACYFEDASAGENKKVIINPTKLQMQGDDAGNYRIAAAGSQTETKATIDPKTVTVSGLKVNNKTYDGTVSGTVNYDAVSIADIVEGDNLTLAQNATATFETASAGNSKTVTVSGLTLSGASAGNYRLRSTEYETAANIEKRVIVLNSGITAEDKEYDGTTAATLKYGNLQFNDKIEGDDLTVTADGQFETADAGTNKTVVIRNHRLGGAAKDNYDLQMLAPQTTTATVRPRVVTVTGLTADKTYDGTTTATLTGTPQAGNLVGSDKVTLSIENPAAAFDNKNAGTNKTVTVPGSHLKLDGADKDNYTLPQTITLTAAITKAPAPTAAPGSLTVANGYAGSYTFDLSQLLPTLSAGQEYGTVTYGSPAASLGGYYGGGAAVSENGILTLPILQNDVTSVGNVGTVTVTVRSRNFEDMILTLNVQSSNRKLPMGEPTLSPETLTYGEPLSAIALSGTMYCQEPTEVPGGEQVVTFAQTGENGRVQVPGTFTWTNPAVKPEAGSYSAQWLFTPEDPVTYLSVSGTATIQVLKAQQAAPKAPELESRGHNSITLKAIPDNANGAKAQYRLGDGAWQDSPTFDGLTAGEEYVFRARYAETENYIASPASGEARLASLPYVLSFQVNGGSDLDSVEAKAGTVISLSAYRPTRSGYSFAGWYAEADFRTRVTSVTMRDDTTVYARWTVRSSSSPATGDGTRLALGGTVLVLSAGALALLLAKRKKRRPER